MNTPNKLTMLRIFLAPFIMLFTLWTALPFHDLVAGLLFLIASVTDILDGNIARKRGLVTNFGKLMDPVADKLLVCATLICFVQRGLCSAWIVYIVLAREFLVTSVRLVAAGDGRVIAANAWGKAKTVSQAVAIGAVYLLQCFLELAERGVIRPDWFTHGWSGMPTVLSGVFLWVSAGFTLISGGVYLWDNRRLFVNN